MTVVVVGLSSGTVLSSDMEMEPVVAGWLGVAGGGLALLSTFGDPLGGVSLGDCLAAGDADLLATCKSAHRTVRNKRVRFIVRVPFHPTVYNYFCCLIREEVSPTGPLKHSHSLASPKQWFLLAHTYCWGFQ